MKTVRLIAVLCIVASCILAPVRANAQASWVAKAARELVEELIQKGGQQGAKELAELGGEALAKEALEKAAQEGGEKLARQLATQTLEHGAALLKVAKESPSRFLSAFDELTPTMKKAAARAIIRDPDSIAGLFSKVGKEVLTVAAKHSGVGIQVIKVLGREGAEALSKVTTDEAIQLSRLAPKLAGVAEPQRQTLLEMIKKAPGKIMDLLEKHPKVLLSTAAVASFLAVKDQIFGKPEIDIVTDENGMVKGVRTLGFVERMCRQTAETFKTPLYGLIWIGGLILLVWGCIKLWAVFRLEKAKVQIKEAQVNQEARREKEQSK